MNSVYLIFLMFATSVQECVLNFIVPVIEKWANNYVLSYTCVRYLRIVLGRKYDFKLLYVLIFGLTRMIDFTAFICLD